MSLHPFDFALWAISCFAEAILAFVILQKGAARRWPFLLSLMLFDVLHTALIVTQKGNYHAYFYIYWYGHALRSFLSLGLLWDVFRSLPALKYVPKRIGLVLLSAGLTVTIGSVLLTTLHHPNTAYKITYEVLMIRECVTVLWIACAVSLLGSISFLGLGWCLESVNVTAGMLASGVAAVVAASLTSSWPSKGHLLDKLQTCVDIAVYLSWVYSLCRPSGSVVPDSALHAVLAEYVEE